MADSNPISQYSRSNADKLYADSRETLFGHLVVERGKSVKAAIEELRPHVKQALKTTESAANWCQKLGIGGVGLGVLVGASTMGIAYAALPILAGCLSLKLWAESRDELPRREAEYHLLRECSNLPKALFALHLRGVTTAVLVGAYDSLISAVEARLERGAEFTESEVGQFLEAKIKALATIAPVTSQSQPSNDQDGQTEKLGIGSKNWEFLSRDNPNCRQAIEVVPEATTAAAPSFTSPNLTPPSSRSELIARLKQDCPLLLKLVKSHPIRAVGVQRSGKTTLVKRLALLRMVLLENHSVTASTPHYEAVNQYPDVFTIAGIRNGQRDYPAIERAWSQMASDVESCQMGNVTYIWDEFGLIDKAIPITPENDPIKTVLTSCLRETMKFQIYPIFILHGETAAFLPGSKGLVTVIMASTVRVEAIGEPVEGDDGLEMIRPTGRFNVTWLDGSKGEGILPAWLSEDFLLGMIPGRKIEKEPIAPPSSSSNHDDNWPVDAMPDYTPEEYYENMMRMINPKNPNFKRLEADARKNSELIRRDNLERLYQSSSSNEGPYADEIRGTWREDFAKNMPPGVDEAEFLRLYNLEKSLQESSVPKDEPIGIDCKPIGIDCKPIAVLHDYLKRRGPKSLKPTVSAMRNTNGITEADLDEELERHDSYQDGIHQLLIEGIARGFIMQDSEGNFRALDKH